MLGDQNDTKLPRYAAFDPEIECPNALPTLSMLKWAGMLGGAPGLALSSAQTEGSRWVGKLQDCRVYIAMGTKEQDLWLSSTCGPWSR